MIASHKASLTYTYRVSSTTHSRHQDHQDPGCSSLFPASLRLTIASGEDRNTGPNVEDLQINMRGKINLIWNQAVIEILLAKVKKEDFEGLPNRSNVYLVDKIKGKLERVRTVWKTAQPRVTETGNLETIKEV